MIHSRPVCSDVMKSITVEAEPCRPTCQGDGWPVPGVAGWANAANGVVVAVSAKAARPMRFDHAWCMLSSSFLTAAAP